MAHLRNTREKKESKMQRRTIEAMRDELTALIGDLKKNQQMVVMQQQERDQLIVSYLELSGWDFLNGEFTYGEHRFTSPLRALKFHESTIVKGKL